MDHTTHTTNYYTGANHTGRSNDQEAFPGEGCFFGMGSSVKFPFNGLNSPYTLVAAGTAVLAQKVSYFSVDCCSLFVVLGCVIVLLCFCVVVLCLLLMLCVCCVSVVCPSCVYSL